MSTQIPARSKRVQPRSPLVRILGLGFGVAVIFGGTVGVGILRLPGTIAGDLRSFWAGGFYIYARQGFATGAGFSCMKSRNRPAPP